MHVKYVKKRAQIRAKIVETFHLLSFFVHIYPHCSCIFAHFSCIFAHLHVCLFLTRVCLFFRARYFVHICTYLSRISMLFVHLFKHHGGFNYVLLNYFRQTFQVHKGLEMSV